MSKDIVDDEVASTLNHLSLNPNVISKEINDPTNLPSTKSGTESFLQGWNKTQKLHLCRALQYHGSSNPRKIIHELITNRILKSAKEIKQAIQYYKMVIGIDTVLESEKEQDTQKPERYSVPLSSWANELTDNNDIDELENEIAETIRIYADFGNPPLPHLTDTVNFRDLYLLLADAMDGKPLTGYSNADEEIIRERILNASAFSSEFMKNAYFDKAFQNIQVSNDFNGPVFTKPSKDQDLSCLNHLLAQKKFNPFNMSECDLKKELDPTKKVRK